MWNHKFFKWKFLEILLLSSFYFFKSYAQTEGLPCSVEAKGSHLIVNIVESLGDDFSNEPEPPVLPISGEPGTDIELKISYPDEEITSRNFVLEGKKLRLVKPLDRDAKDLSSIVFQLTCIVTATGKRKTIPLVVTISDLNDNTPEFINTPYQVTLPESTKVDSIVFRGLSTKDPDSNINGQVEYFIEDSKNSPFKIDFPHQGIVRLAKPLDYETSKVHFVNVIAKDRALKPENRLSSTTTLTVNVIDSDDLDPKFGHELYTAKITSGLISGPLEVRPEKIRADDQDTLRSEINYSIISGTPGIYDRVFKIDLRSGVVIQVGSVSRDETTTFELTIKAEEVMPAKRFTTSRLVISVMPENVSPPVVQVSSKVGYVDENSEVGTFVVDESGNTIVFIIEDRDRTANETSLKDYVFEMTTKSFKIDSDGKLIVNEKNLDRDPPNENKLGFQVFVREVDGENDHRKSSSPVTMTIHLRDVNDNAPVLKPIKDVTIAEGAAKRTIATISATDNDSDKKIEYKILSVSNNGIRKFFLDPNTGRIDVIAPVRLGEHFSITVAAIDSGGKTNQAVMDVRITASPNLREPVFNQFLYETTVNEAAPKFSSVITVEAKDPESDPVKYTIIGGNEDEHFKIEEATGEIQVLKSLDREEKSQFTLTIKAEDNARKFSTATLKIEVGDANDQIPEFSDLPYEFTVKEGLAGAQVGQVKATDADVGKNGKISYKIQNSTFFEINNSTGIIQTKAELDFETQKMHEVVVTATDNGDKKKLSATATVTIMIQDTSDEVPTFVQPLYEATVPENVENFAVVTVQAVDIDTEPSITYTILSGDLDKFAIDPKSGSISTKKGLDYELSKTHFLIVGTEEGKLGGLSDFTGTTCQVEVKVGDVNDLSPVFTKLPHGNFLQVRNDAKIGEVIGSVEARDSDGTNPGNVVKYELVEAGSSEKALQYFKVNQDSGDIEIINDLTQELFNEYKIEINAFDDGNPRLETSTQLMIFVKQVVTQPPESGMGFADLVVPKVAVMENSEPDTLVTTLEIIQKSQRPLPIKCDVVEVKNSRGERVKNSGLFLGSLNANKDCDLFVGNQELDREVEEFYKVVVKLNSLSAFVNPERSVVEVDIEITDSNDNPPKFIYDNGHNDILASKQYLVSIQDNTPIGSQIFQVQAVDSDSGPFGEVRYSLSDSILGSSYSSYFEIDPIRGIIKTKKLFKSIQKEELPFRLEIMARDNPNSKADINIEKTQFVVNLVKPGDGVVLTLANLNAESVGSKRGQLMDVLQEQTGLVIEIDQILPSMTPYGNGSCCRVNPRNTDVYFHAIDPHTNEILPYDSQSVESKITGKQPASDLKYAVSGRLAVQASDIHPPYVNSFTGSKNLDPNSLPIKQGGSNFDGIPALLISIGCIVFAIGAAAIVYLCLIRKKYECRRVKSPKMIVIPRYEPVFMEPSVKEYETQVLQMSIPLGDDNDTLRKTSHYDRDLWHPFHLDNISYITKDKTVDSMSTMSTLFPSGQFNHKDLGHYSSVDGDSETPIKSPLFQRNNGVFNNQTYLSASKTTDNVVFGDGSHFTSSTPRHKHRPSPDHDINSPIDLTTQL